MTPIAWAVTIDITTVNNNHPKISLIAQAERARDACGVLLIPKSPKARATTEMAVMEHATDKNKGKVIPVAASPQ